MAKLNNSVGNIVYGRYIALSYNSSTILQVWIKDVPADIFENPEQYLVSIAMRQINGTPYNQVSRLTYEIRESAKQFVVNAIGSGFVSGHKLDTSVIIIKLN